MDEVMHDSLLLGGPGITVETDKTKSVNVNIIMANKWKESVLILTLLNSCAGAWIRIIKKIN